MRKVVLCMCFVWWYGLFVYGQADDIYTRYNIHRSPVRLFLNKFSFTLTSGYALTNYSHSVDGFYFYQDRETQLILGNQNELGDIFSGYDGWMGQPFLSEEVTIDDPFDVPNGYLENPVNNPLLGNRQVLIDTDTMSLGFSSYSPTVPIMFAIDYDIHKFRLGAGLQYERHYMKSLRPTVMESQIRNYEPNFSKTSYFKYFGLVGYQFYDWWDYTFVAELQVGRARSGKEINQSVVGLGQYFFTNIGINIEKNLSEYFRVVVRPSYDIKGYTVQLPDATNLRHTNHAFMVQIGVSINIPEIPRSPMKSDHVQLKHVIVDPSKGRLIEVRGQPFWKKQNPKVGENHRRLWRYKLKNRRKIDPY